MYSGSGIFIPDPEYLFRIRNTIPDQEYLFRIVKNFPNPEYLFRNRNSIPDPESVIRFGGGGKKGSDQLRVIVDRRPRHAMERNLPDVLLERYGPEFSPRLVHLLRLVTFAHHS